MQELVQPEGDRDFALDEEILAHVCRNLGCPVLAKEVGCGLDPDSAQRMMKAGVSALDVGGRGGTSWPWIEAYRASSANQEVSSVFRDWGIPTAYALSALSHLAIPLVATGGMRTGLDLPRQLA